MTEWLILIMKLDCWFRIVVRDLQFVIPMLSIIRQRLESDPDIFMQAFSNLLKVLSKV